MIRCKRKANSRGLLAIFYYLFLSFPQTLLKDTGSDVIRLEDVFEERPPSLRALAGGHSERRCHFFIAIIVHVLTFFFPWLFYMSVPFLPPFSFICLFIQSFPESPPLCQMPGIPRNHKINVFPSGGILC